MRFILVFELVLPDIRCIRGGMDPGCVRDGWAVGLVIAIAIDGPRTNPAIR